MMIESSPTAAQVVNRMLTLIQRHDRASDNKHAGTCGAHVAIGLVMRHVVYVCT